MIILSSVKGFLVNKPERKKTQQNRKRLYPEIVWSSLPQYKNTDFSCKSEFALFQRLGPLPENYAHADTLDELNSDIQFYKSELELIGIMPGTDEYRKSMKLYFRWLSL